MLVSTSPPAHFRLPLLWMNHSSGEETPTLRPDARVLWNVGWLCRFPLDSCRCRDAQFWRLYGSQPNDRFTINPIAATTTPSMTAIHLSKSTFNSALSFFVSVLN